MNTFVSYLLWSGILLGGYLLLFRIIIRNGDASRKNISPYLALYLASGIAVAAAVPVFITNSFVGFLILPILLLWLAIAMHDLLFQTIPMVLVYSAIGLAFALQIAGQFVDLVQTTVISGQYHVELLPSLLAGGIYALVFWALWFFSAGKAMGEGDAYMGFAIGLLLGPSKPLTSFYISIFVALAYGIVLGIVQKKIKGIYIPLVPFLVLGAILAFSLPIDILTILVGSTIL